jgi:predicted metal-binding protein
LLSNTIKPRIGNSTDSNLWVAAGWVMSWLVVYALIMHLFAETNVAPSRSGVLDIKQCSIASGCDRPTPVVTLPPKAARTGVCQLAPISSHCSRCPGRRAARCLKQLKKSNVGTASLVDISNMYCPRKPNGPKAISIGHGQKIQNGKADLLLGTQ